MESNIEGTVLTLCHLQDGIAEAREFRDVLGTQFLNMLDEALLIYLQTKFQDCSEICEIMIDLVWEKLNTGHWKNVSPAWRSVYIIISILKAKSQYSILKNKFSEVQLDSSIDLETKLVLLNDIKQILKTCDMGLIMGYSLTMTHLLSQYASFIHKIYAKLRKNNNEFLKHEQHDIFCEPPVKKCKLNLLSSNISVAYNPSIEYFQNFILKNNQPVILKNCLNNWPALNERRWNIEYILNVAGGRLVPVEVGSKYTDEEWSQKLMTIEEFIHQYILTENCIEKKGYLAQYQLFNQIEDLRKDIIIPDYCAIDCEGDDDNIDINAWFGPAYTVSPLHRDEKENLFCQVFGEKYFKLYDPVYSDKLYIHDNHLLQTTSQIDVENVDQTKFPDFHKVPFTEIILEPGDMLYMPPMYWHFVKSVSASFSVSFWWPSTSQ